MGSLHASEYASMVAEGQIPRHTALLIHLTSNHFPPLSEQCLPFAERAIDLANEGKADEIVSVELEGGDASLTDQQGNEATAADLIEAWHLDWFLD